VGPTPGSHSPLKSGEPHKWNAVIIH
jgi:hypothetical protein